MSKKAEIITVDQPDVLTVQSSPVNEPTRLIEMAINQNADIEKLERLMDLQDRWNADQARKAFNVALANFQAICPQIRKLKQGHNYKYAPLADIVAQVKTPLSASGLSYRFEQDHSNMISVTCIVSHTDGHSERTTMTAMPDGSGSKNQVQAIGSTVQYLMRYTFIGALGITTADEDIDGRLPQQEQPDQQPLAIQYYPVGSFSNNFPQWQQAIQSGKTNAEALIAKIETKGTLTDEQKQQINSVQQGSRQ